MSYQSVGRGKGGNPWNRKAFNNVNKKSEEKFRDNKEKLQASVQKHLDNQEYSSSSDEEALQSDSILTSVFKNYSQFNSNCEGVERTQQFLENTFQSGSGSCLICIASIKRNDAIWNCLECFGYFHLICIQKWANDSIYQLKAAQEELPAFKKSDKINWSCPKCRHHYDQKEVPQKYFCFCGKVEDPSHHPWLVPHSCGDTCNKLLQPECGHYCLLLCHPGPCPPCPKTVQSYCHCRKQGPKHLRCSNKLWSCNAKCGKPLLCRKHPCEESCHSGDCPPCPKESVQKCQCGLEKRKQPCFNPSWQCGKVCGKPFSCGFHNCSLICHEGPCGDCPLSQQRTCPCGKTSHILPCTEDVPTCNDTCNKLLECGSHNCSHKCHKGKCGTCLDIVTKVCRCGQHKKELPCQKTFLCETKCKRVKNCSRHPCNRKCCDLNCPPCEKPCGRTLKCGYHKCPSICHQGQCYPCPEIVQIKCRCGKTAINVPCGRQKKTSPPKCNKLCQIPPSCHHSSREKHNCHFGECPPCKQICGKKHENCPHDCPAPCHSSVLVKVEEDFIPSAPWEVFEPKLKRSCLPCPDCQFLVPVTCLGGHETCDTPCYKAKSDSCQRLCGRMLKCGNHKCKKVCHLVTGAGDGFYAGENCMECEEECTKERPPGCTHRCPKPCHPGSCPPCNLNLKVKCHCGIFNLFVHCGDLNNADENTKSNLLKCGNMCPKNYPCGHKCKSSCHPGECPGSEFCRKKVKMFCKCGRLKKEIPCDVVTASKKTNLDCDEVCAAKYEEEKRAKELEMEKKKKEEEKKNRLELERFERKFHGRKKQKEKVVTVEDPSFLSKYWVVIAGAVAGVSVTLIYLYSYILQ